MNPEDYRALQVQIDALKDDAPHPYQVCSSLAGEVQQLLSQNHYQEADVCLRSITEAYNGACTNRLKMAIENAFLYKLGGFVFSSCERKRLLQAIPQSLREKMIQQVIASGI